MVDIPLKFATDARAATAQPQPLAAATTAWPVRVLMMWLVLVVMLLIVYARSIGAMRFVDPDDALRLMEVRDLLAGQSWFDVHQYRIAAPEGVAMHWSRLVDVPIAAVILLLRPVLGTLHAELVAVVAIPLLTLLATLMLVGRLAAKFFDAETVGIVCLITGIAAPLLFQMTPLRIDHHGWQVVLALAALNGLAARDAVRGGLVIGLALAALLAISIEGLPITVVFLGVLALRGLIPNDSSPLPFRGGAGGGGSPLGSAPGDSPHPNPSPEGEGLKGGLSTHFAFTGRGLIGPGARSFVGLASASAALALGSIAIFFGTRGTADLVTHCDQISPVHLALFAVVAFGSAGLFAWAPRRWPLALGALGMLGAATLGTYLGLAPQCRGGAFVAMDPLVYKFWYEGVSEGLPFWHLPVAIAVETVGVPLIGLVSIVWLWWDAKSAQERLWWRDHALVLAGALLIAAMLARASATACAIAAVPTGALAMRWIVVLRTIPPLRRIVGYLGIMVMLMPPLPVIGWTLLSARFAPTAAKAAAMPPPSQCSYPIAARALDALPATDLFMPLDSGPDILVRSHQRVVATGHHRNAAGMHDVVAAFLGTPDEAHAIIQRRRATLIVVCPDIAEPGNYKFYAPNGFMAQLLRGQTPRWLERVNLAPGSHMLFWKVKG